MQHTGMKVVGKDENPTSNNYGEEISQWTTDNATKAQIMGLELEYHYVPWRGARLFGYVSLMQARLKEAGQIGDDYMCAERAGAPPEGYPGLASDFEALSGQTPCTEGDLDLSGHHLTHAPDWSLSVSFEQNLPLVGDWSLVPYVTVRAQEFMYLDWLNYDGPHLSQKQPRYAKINTTLRLANDAWKAYIEAYINNATDVQTRNLMAAGPGIVGGYYDPPRQFGVRISADM
jgi:outer membrane receptor protein involved in Fe transport